MRIGLGYRQQPFVEFVNGCWQIWVIYNKDISSGTKLVLNADGTCDQYIIQNGDVMAINRMK